MLIKRTERQARRGTLAAALQRAIRRRSRPPHLPAPLRPRGRRARRARRAAARQRAQGGSRSPAAGGRAGHHPQEHLHALLGRLHGDRRSRERRVDRPGARLGSPINRGSHCAKGAAVRELVHGDRRLKYPMKLVNGQWTRMSWDQAIDEIGDKLMADPREVRAGFGLLARLGQVLQRGRLSLPQVRGVLGHQQRRSPGAHLPFDHRRRRGQYLGLRRDDQQLQRHPQRQDHDHHGRQSGRSASGVAAAPARRQGAQPRELHRDRSAADAHRRARDRICAHPLRHRHSGDLGHALAHLQERLGGQGVHRAARLRHGRRPQGGREVDARRGRARHRRAGGAAQARRRDVRQGEALDADLVHGRRPSTRSAPPTCARSASCCSPPAMSAASATAPTSSAATATCRARPISVSIS